MKVNVVVFLIEGGLSKDERIKLVRELGAVIQHSLSEIGPEEEMSNSEICKRVKGAILHHLALEKEKFEKVKHVVVIEGLEVREEEETIRPRVKKVPPVAGWTGEIEYFIFPYVENVYDPPVGGDESFRFTLALLSALGGLMSLGRR